MHLGCWAVSCRLGGEDSVGSVLRHFNDKLFDNGVLDDNSKAGTTRCDVEFFGI